MVPSSNMFRVVKMDSGEKRLFPVPVSTTWCSIIDIVKFQMASEALKAGGGAGEVSASPKAPRTLSPSSRCANLKIIFPHEMSG